MAEFSLPQAGNTVSNRCRDTSRYTLVPSGVAKGQTPPGACPVIGSTSSKASIFSLFPKESAYTCYCRFSDPRPCKDQDAVPFLPVQGHRLGDPGRIRMERFGCQLHRGAGNGELQHILVPAKLSEVLFYLVNGHNPSGLTRPLAASFVRLLIWLFRTAFRNSLGLQPAYCRKHCAKW